MADPAVAGHAGGMPELPSDFSALPRPALDLDPDRDAIADFYDYADLLTDDEVATLRRLRSYLARDVAPVVDDAWERAEFPMQLVKGFAELDLAGMPYGLAGRAPKLVGQLTHLRVAVGIAVQAGSLGRSPFPQHHGRPRPGQPHDLVQNRRRHRLIVQVDH